MAGARRTMACAVGTMAGSAGPLQPPNSSGYAVSALPATTVPAGISASQLAACAGLIKQGGRSVSHCPARQA